MAAGGCQSLFLEGRSDQGTTMGTTMWVLWTWVVVVDVVRFGENSNIF